MKIMMHAYDIAPARNLARIATEALDQTHHVSFVGGGKLGDMSFNKLDGPNVLITGLSALGKAEQELELGQMARNFDIPWLVVADAHETWARPEAKGNVGHAIVLVASPAEIKKAKAFGYGRAEYLNGPPLWQTFFATNSVEFESSLPKSSIILVVGIKDGRITDGILETVIAAMDELGISWELIFKPHGREVQETVDQDRRASILERAPVLEAQVELSNLFRSVDLSVCAITSSSPIEAAHKRVPVIAFENEDLLERMLAHGITTSWFTAEAGAAAKATPKTLPGVIANLLTDKGAAELRRRQEATYPFFEHAEPVERRIVNFLSELVKKS